MMLIKIGGGKAINYNAIAEDIKTLSEKEQVIIVHGASSTRDEIADKLGIPTQRITSPSGVTSVYTDKDAIDIFLMSYCGLINKRIVATLQDHGVNALGLSGIDGRLWEAKRKDVVYAIEGGRTKLIRDNLTGKVERVNSKLLQLLCGNGYTPVICPPALSFDGQIVDTDNDAVVVVLADALHIEKIVFLFEAAGLLKDFRNEKSLVKKITKKDLMSFMQSAEGSMKKKLLGTKKIVDMGFSAVYFGDGRIKNPVISALSGKGTVITA